MSDITQEEFDSLSYLDKQFYLENHKYTDCKVINGKLHVVHYSEYRLNWARFMELYNAVENTRYSQIPDGEIGFYRSSDYGRWNEVGRKYIEYGFEHYLTIHVRTPDHSDEGKQAEKQLLMDWILSHGGTEDELKSIRWNWHGYQAEFICRFTETPYEHIPEKMHKWLKKNPQWAHKVYSQEILNELGH
jgi:hypothetical protein